MIKVGNKVESVDAEGVWNTCTIQSIVDDKVLVRYDGWPSQYDEYCFIHTIVPLGTHTRRRKCFSLRPNQSYLPCIAFLRTGSDSKGEKYLREEPLLGILLWQGSKIVYEFVHPDKLVSWSSRSPVSMPSTLADLLADEEDLKFIQGTLPVKFLPVLPPLSLSIYSAGPSDRSPSQRLSALMDEIKNSTKKKKLPTSPTPIKRLFPTQIREKETEQVRSVKQRAWQDSFHEEEEFSVRKYSATRLQELL